MIVVQDRRAVVVPAHNPARVTTIVPTAKTFTFRGRTLVAVPHKIDETKVLRNLGINVPPPILYYYDWPGRVEPFSAQKETAAFLTLHSRAFVLNGLGTGKSLSALWAYDYLRSIGKVKKVLISSPLSTLERTWADEIFTHFPHLSYVVLHDTASKRRKLLEQDVDVYIVNHNGVAILADDLAKRPDIDLIIIDEISQAVRNYRTDMWKAHNKVVNPKGFARAAWGLTATPIPNSPVDVYGQCKLLVPANVPLYFTKFRDMVMRQVGPYTWVPRSNAIEIVMSMMQPAIRFTREECIDDLPPVMYEMRSVELTKEQHQAYKAMQATLRAQAEKGEIIAVNEAVKLTKLVQIACGVAYSPTGEEVSLPCQPRLNAVLEIVHQSENKVIVFVPFVSAVSHVAEFLMKSGVKVAVIHGGVSKRERDEIFYDFQKKQDGVQVLVAQPAAMSHGLTLTAANTIVWYAPITSNDTFEQANGRVSRPGQKFKQFIIMLEGSPIEKKIYDRLSKKQSLQGILLEEVRVNRAI